MEETQSKNVGLLGAITNWFQHPFNTEGNAVNWILFFMLFIIAAWLWNTVLLAITKEI